MGGVALSALYLYAIIERANMPAPPPLGLEGAPVFAVERRKSAAVVSQFSALAATPNEVNLWRHEAVVEALMAERAVLPVRFGALLADKAAVRSVLDTHYAEFMHNLPRVRGRVEVGLRVLWQEDVPPMDTGHHLGAGSGRAYLLARLQDEHRVRGYHQQAKTLAQTLDAELVSLAAASSRRILTTPRLLLCAAYLVERQQLSVFQQHVADLTVAYPQLHFLCTGPWPPYSFVMSKPAVGSLVKGAAHASY
jgi:hypothetical protein